jgi:hypothetical protein
VATVAVGLLDPPQALSSTAPNAALNPVTNFNMAVSLSSKPI